MPPPGDDDDDGGPSTSTQLALVLGGLVGVAGGLSVLTFLYWRRTRPVPYNAALDALGDLAGPPPITGSGPVVAGEPTIVDGPLGIDEALAGVGAAATVGAGAAAVAGDHDADPAQTSPVVEPAPDPSGSAPGAGERPASGGPGDGPTPVGPVDPGPAAPTSVGAGSPDASSPAEGSPGPPPGAVRPRPVPDEIVPGGAGFRVVGPVGAAAAATAADDLDAGADPDEGGDEGDPTETPSESSSPPAAPVVEPPPFRFVTREDLDAAAAGDSTSGADRDDPARGGGPGSGPTSGPSAPEGTVEADGRHQHPPSLFPPEPGRVKSGATGADGADPVVSSGDETAALSLWEDEPSPHIAPLAPEDLFGPDRR